MRDGRLLLCPMNWVERISRSPFSFRATSLFHFATWTAFPPSDYFWNSVTVGLASRRPSHIPSHENVRASRRCPVRNLDRSRSSVPRIVTIQGHARHKTFTTKAWVSLCDRHSSFVSSSEGVRIPRSPGFPTSHNLDRWSLGFRQSSVHHRIQTLRELLGYPASPHSAFTPSSCPFGAFPLR